MTHASEKLKDIIDATTRKYMLAGHSSLTYRNTNIFVERIEDTHILLWYNGILIRHWKWDAPTIDCYFEENPVYTLNLEDICILKYPLQSPYGIININNTNHVVIATVEEIQKKIKEITAIPWGLFS